MRGETIDEFRDWWEDAWRSADAEAARLRDPQEATLLMHQVYQSLSAEREMLAKEIIIEWLEGQDPSRRFVAMTLIGEFAIREASEPLRRLERDLRDSSRDDAKIDLGLVRNCMRILERAVASGRNGPAPA